MLIADELASTALMCLKSAQHLADAWHTVLRQPDWRLDVLHEPIVKAVDDEVANAEKPGRRYGWRERSGAGVLEDRGVIDCCALQICCVAEDLCWFSVVETWHRGAARW